MTSPGARYSAGTAFLDVVPSFRGVQEAIGKKAREMEKALGKDAGENFGKEFEKGASRAVDRALGTSRQAETEKQGKAAGQKYAGAFATELKKATRDAQREISASIKLTGDDKDLKQNLREIEARLKALGKAKIGIDMDAGKALAEVEELRVAMQVLQEHADRVDLKVNTAQAFQAIERTEKRLAKLRDVEVEIKVDERSLGRTEATIKARLAAAMKEVGDVVFNATVDVNTAKLQALKAEMKALSDKTVGIDIGAAEAMEEIAVLRNSLRTLADDKTVNIQVRADAAAAAAELAGIKALVELIDGKKAKVEVKVDMDKSFVQRVQAVRNQLLGADADGRSAADGFRAFNAMVLAGAAILPGVVPAIAALAGGLALLGPLAIGAGAGIAVMGIAFSGIQNAVQALGKSQDNAGKDAEASAKRIRSASRSVEDAQRSVQRAEESGARQIQDANRAVSDARENAAEVARSAAEKVASAVQSQEDAERDLVRAQDDVVRAQEAVTRAREAAREELEDLQLSLRGGALAERQAVFDLQDAQDAYNKALADPDASADDRARRLLDLEKEQLNLDRVRESNGDLAAEQAEWARTGIEGSQQVVAAQDGVRTANEGVAAAQRRVQDAVADVAAAVSDGQRAQADAAQQISDAVANQSQVQSDAARTIEDAQRNLQQAQEDYTTAINETSASTQALEVAMGKLGPAGQAFAVFIAGVLPQFRELRDIAQAGILPGVQEAIDDILTRNGPLLREFMGNMGETLGNLFRQFGDMMTSPQWQGIWATFNQYAPIFMQQFGEMAMAMLTFFGELFQVLAPYAEKFGDALVRAAEGAAAWAASLEDSQGFRDVMEWLFTYGPMIWADVKDIFEAVGRLFISLLPLGLLVLDAISGVARFINSIPIDVLGAVVTTILGLVVAFQLATGAIALISGIMAIAAVPIAGIIFVILAVIAALVALYLYSDDFREFMDGIFRQIGEIATRLWDTILKPFFDEFAAAWPYISQIIQFAWDYVIKPILGYWYGTWFALANAILWAWENIIWPTWDAIKAVISFLWTFVLEPIFAAIGVAWGVLATGIEWAWNNIIKPVWDVLMAVAQVLFAFLVVTIFGPIAVAWKLLSEGFKWAWENLIKPAWGALSDAAADLWTWLSEKFGWVGDAWDALSAAFGYIYDTRIKPVFDAFRGLWEDIQEGFGNFVDALGVAWELLQNKLSRPINFVIEMVLNRGLFSAFNWVIDTLGLPGEWKIDPFGQIGDPSTHFAAGGRVPGWSPNDKADNIPAMLTAGEYVHPVDSVKYYGSDTMELIRKRKIPREALDSFVHDPTQHYATGGFVKSRRREDALPVYMQPSGVAGQADEVILPASAATGAQLFAVIKGSFPRAKANDMYRPGANDYHGRNMAVDLGEEGFAGGNGRPYLAAMNRWIHDVFGAQTTELIYDGLGDDRPDLKNGRPLNYGPSTSAQHHNHVHWAMEGPINGALAGGAPVLGSDKFAFENPNIIEWAWNGLSGIAQRVWDSTVGVFDHIKNAIVEPMANFGREFGDNAMTKIVGALPGNMVGKVWDKIKDVVGGIFSAENYSSYNDTQAANAAGAAADRGTVGEIVKAAFAVRGWDTGAQWNAVDYIISHESGWNPQAQNPGSTASGLFQHINATWMANRPAGATATRMRDATIPQQAQAGRQYIERRYGDPIAAYRHWLSNHSYSEGGEVTDGDTGGQAVADSAAPTLYDTGGWLPPGITTVLNASNKPEPVLTSSMWAELVDARGGDDDGASGITALHLHEVNADLSEAIDRVNHTVRVLQRGGRYAGAGTGGSD